MPMTMSRTVAVPGSGRWRREPGMWSSMLPSVMGCRDAGRAPGSAPPTRTVCHTMHARWASQTLRTADWQTWKWKPSPRMCWRKSSVSNSVRSAAQSPRHEPKPDAQPPHKALQPTVYSGTLMVHLPSLHAFRTMPTFIARISQKARDACAIVSLVHVCKGAREQSTRRAFGTNISCLIFYKRRMPPCLSP